MSTSESVSRITEVALQPLTRTLFRSCPGGLCEWIQSYNVVFLTLIALEGVVFLCTLLPPIFSWKKRKPDGKKRVLFAVVACVTFYFWLTFLILNSIYCFGFYAVEGPCKNFNRSTAVVEETGASNVSADGPFVSDAELPPKTTRAPVSSEVSQNESNCFSWSVPPHEADLRNITIINILIIVVLIIVLIANAKEGKNT